MKTLLSKYLPKYNGVFTLAGTETWTVIGNKWVVWIQHKDDVKKTSEEKTMEIKFSVAIYMQQINLDKPK